MSNMRRVLVLAVLVTLGLFTSQTMLGSTAAAEVVKPCVMAKYTGDCLLEAKSDSDDDEVGPGSPVGTRSGPSQYEIVKKQAAEYRRAMAKHEAQDERYHQCLVSSRLPERCTAPDPIDAVDPGAWGELLPTGGSAPTLTPGQAGAMAVARLKLPLNAPKVGPDPKINKWKMAAVGFPLWIWAEGPTHVGPVSDSVGGLSVSLDAQLTKTVFRMGDGNSVTCQGAGTPYRRSVEPGTPSPSCGYRYEQPSLPKGDYTVTAISYWAVTWTINGTSGLVTVPRHASSPLPVGELQVLVR